MSTTQEIFKIIEDGANSRMSLEEIIRVEMDDWERSKDREWMVVGQDYYENQTDILNKKRTAIGPGGKLVEVENLANNKLINGFVRKLVDQKVGYLLSKPLSLQTDNSAYQKVLTDFFDKSFLRQLKNVGKAAINKGIGWLQVYYNNKGELKTKLIPSEQIIPLWSDTSHTDLDAVIRVYEVEVFEGRLRKKIKKVEFWDQDGVKRFVEDRAIGGLSGLITDIEAGGHSTHLSVFTEEEGESIGLNWERVPFIPFKYNDSEIPLVKIVKSLVDDYDKHFSDNSNNLEDLPNSIYVVKDYDGTDLGEFRRNISQYRAAKTSGEGGIDTLELKVDIETFKTHTEMLRKNIFEFGRGIDTQSDKFGNSPSGIALRFLYADLDMDANDIETEFQAALEQLLWFIDTHIANTIGTDYSGEQVDIIFNRDILINETEAITNAKDSVGVISDETIVANHPWVTDPTEEQNRMEKERQSALTDPLDPFKSQVTASGAGDSDE